MEFSDFWSKWPHKRNRASAEKAFKRMSAENQRMATERCEEWCAQWRKENPKASHIHASTYLNQRRFVDLEETRKINAEARDGMLKMQAEWIRENREYLCRNISQQNLNEIISLGLVTKEECERAGVV